VYQIRIKCPRCNNHADFALASASEYQVLEIVQGQPAQRPAVTVRHMQPQQRIKAFGVASCPLCHMPVMVVFEATIAQMNSMQSGIANREQRVFTSVNILETHPEGKKPSRDPAYPEEIREIFVEVQEDLAANRSPARIVSACRSVLDVCTKKLGGAGNTLSQRIDALRASGVLTQYLADWAHAVRIDGNEAIHELSATHKEAQELVEFIRTFLDLAFVLPRNIQERRQAAAAPP